VRRPGEEQAQGNHSPVWTWSRNNLKAPKWSLCGGTREGYFRFLDRHGVCGQSSGDWNVHRVASKRTKEIQKLYYMDAYHTFLDGGTYSQILIFSIVYVALFLFFALGFLAISDECNLGIEGKYLRAFYLSIQTFVTIGYGVPDPYYNGCWQGTILLTFQSLVAYFFNAVVIGSIFVRLTRPQKRASMVLFSHCAVIRQINGALYFMFQVCEMKSNDAIEAKVRCYCIRHDRNGDQTYQTHKMRLQHPDDELGGNLLLKLPTKVVHRIDNWSPLSPASLSEKRRRMTGAAPGVRSMSAPTDHQRASAAFHWPEVPLRQVDAEQGNRDTCICAVCGSGFCTVEQLRRHVEYNASQDEANEVPEKLSHKPFSDIMMNSWGWTLAELDGDGEEQGAEATSKLNRSPSMRQWAVASVERQRQEVEEFLSERYVEVVVLVEGIEPTTSSTLQARHSYLFPVDVVWDRDFADCTLFGKRGAPCAVDLTRFQELVPSKPIPVARPPARRRLVGDLGGSADSDEGEFTTTRTRTEDVPKSPWHESTAGEDTLLL